MVQIQDHMVHLILVRLMALRPILGHHTVLLTLDMGLRRIQDLRMAPLILVHLMVHPILGMALRPILVHLMALPPIPAMALPQTLVHHMVPPTLVRMAHLLQTLGMDPLRIPDHMVQTLDPLLTDLHPIPTVPVNAVSCNI
jgi:hypothetical protein